MARVKAEQWDNVGLYSEEFFDNAIDIMENFIAFCQDVLQNNKKVINTKLAEIRDKIAKLMKKKQMEENNDES